MFKKTLFLFITAALALSACGTLEVHLDQTPTRSVDSGEVATIVAATLATILSANAAPTATPAPEAGSTTATQCKGALTGIILTMPNHTWNCSPEILKSGSGEMEIIHISSQVFTIYTGYQVGRDLWCEPTQNENCVVTSFYKKNAVELSLYQWYGQNKEIFGYIQRSESPIMISIKYQNMETRELTPTEMDELMQLIDTITFNKP